MNRYYRREEPDKDIEVKFKNVEILTEELIGSGSYGAVRKAKCDEVLCAAKTLHPILFDQTGRFQTTQDTPYYNMGKYERECRRMAMVRHPNIVQHLGLHKDKVGFPVLLMEHMDDNLTHYLEVKSEAVPYHIQVNVCLDIARALLFLHSNDIIHKNLSSNNVLLIGNARHMRAKISDFGMAWLSDINSQDSRKPPTVRPGVDVYMAPEAVQEKPEYSDKVDCFSFGVIMIQILTRKYPNPGNRHTHVELKSGETIIRIIPEIERRKDHINEIDDTAPLLPVALSCLKNKGAERPSAQKLCEELSGLTRNQDYVENERKEKELVKSLEKKLKRDQRMIKKLKKKIPEDEMPSR
jgi:serine/threonine-protein kinase TNNI3K